MVSSKLLQPTLVQVCRYVCYVYTVLRKYCVMCLDLCSVLFIDGTEIIIKHTQKPNTHSDLLFVSRQIEWVKDVPCPVFVLSHKTNYTHMYEFLWSTAAISASDKPEPKSGNHHMPPNTHTLSY